MRWQAHASPLWVPVALLGLAMVLAVALGVVGPLELRARTAETVAAELEVIARQGAARIDSMLDEVAARLADPEMRKSSGIEQAVGPNALREALQRVPQSGLPEGVLLFVHDAEGRVLAADDSALGPMAAQFEAHQHLPGVGGWASGAGVCPECLSHLHQIDVASPLGGGRFLAAGIDAARVAERALESLLAEPGGVAWLTDPSGETIYAVGGEPPHTVDEGWTRASALVGDSAPGWRVQVALRDAVVGRRVASAAAGLLLGSAAIGLMLLAAGALLFRDLRRRQRIQLRRAALMAHQDKLLTLGVLAASVGHELRNIVTGVVGNLAFARDVASAEPALAGSDVVAALDDAQQCAERMEELARSLTAFGRRDDVAPEPRPLSAAIEEALRLVRPMLKHGPPVERDFRADPVVLQVGGQLTQVFLNLLRNAAEAMEGRTGRIRVEVSSEGDQAWAVVEDDGPGIAPEARAHLFEPFFTTKPAGVGTGLGLKVCRDIVRRHGGRMTIESGERGGARVRIVLPSVQTCMQRTEARSA